MRTRIVMIFAFILFISGIAFHQEYDFWPTSGWKISTPEKQGMDGSLLADLDKKIEAGDYGYVDAMLVIRNGYIVYEKTYQHDYVKINDGKDPSPNQYNYYNPEWHPFYKGTKLHTLQSITKSVTSAAIGIAIDKNEIQGIDVKILDFFDKDKILNVDERKKKMTLKDLLTMRAGIDWNESSSYTVPDNSCVQMENSDDWIKFVIDRQMSDEPGTLFEYNSGASQLLSAIIKKSTGMHVDKYVEKHIFKPLGINNYYWKITPTNFPDTEGGLYLEPQSLAKIGYLYLKKGIWEEKQVINKDWVQMTLKPYVEDIAPENDNDNRAYGYLWWLLPNKITNSYVYACLGYGGQYLLIAPECNVIAVFNAWNIYENRGLPRTVFFDYVLKAVNK